MNPTLPDWSGRALSPADAVAPVRSGAHVFIHGAAATPIPLVEALSARRDLEGVRLWHLHTNGPAPFAEPGREKEFRSISLFTGAPPSRRGAPTLCPFSSPTSPIFSSPGR